MYQVDEKGFFGKFGGAYVPEILYKCVTELQQAYKPIIESEEFKKEYRALLPDFATKISLPVTPLAYCADLPAQRLLCLGRSFLSRLPLTPRVPTVLTICSTGISTCCPSATSSDLALGPDLPRADQLYPGILGYSANRILTYFSLLIPAFSLQCSPLLLTVQLLPAFNAPLPTLRFRSFGSMFQPRTFSAQDLSTSELLRTL